VSSPDLRPLSFGELLDRTFTCYRRHFWVFVGIMAIPQVFLVGMQLLVEGLGRYGTGLQAGEGVSEAEAAQVMGVVVGMFLGVLLVFAIYGLAYMAALGAVTYVVSETQFGRTLTIRQAYRLVKRRLWGLVRLWTAIALRAFACAVTIILLPVAFLMILWYSLSVPAMLVEDLSAGQALKRSAFLTKGYRNQVFLAMLLTVLVGWSIAFLLQGPFTLAQFFWMREGSAGPFWLAAANALAGGVAQAIGGPLLMIALALLYFDIRVRKEGFDLQVMLDALKPAEATAPPDSAPEAVLERSSLAAVILLSIVTLGLYVPFWYLSRREALNSLQSSEKFPIHEPLAALGADIGYFVVISFTDGSWPWALACLSAIICILLSFRARRALLDHDAARRRGMFSSGLTLDTETSFSVVATFLLGIWYVQYKLNQLVETWEHFPPPQTAPAPAPSTP
jgi:hypothetical protein